VKQPQPPGSYKKQETIDAWLESQNALFAEAAPRLKITGQIKQVFAIDLRQGKLFDSTKVEPSEKNERVGCQFARWLLDVQGYRSCFADETKSRDSYVGLYGFDLKPFLRVLGVECNTAGFEVPLGLWYGNDAVYDPHEMLVEAAGGPWRQMITLAKIAERCGLSLTEDFVPFKNPAHDSRVVAEFVTRYKLVPTLDAAGAAKLLEAKAFSTQAPGARKKPLAEESEEDAPASGVRPRRKAKRKAARSKGR
jgi:hypothetical protein